MECMNGTLEKDRPLAKFHPNFWGDVFFYYTPPDEAPRRQMEQEAEELRKLIRKELLGIIEDPKERLIFLDNILRLGVSYHFEREIEANLQKFHKKLQHNICYKDDLHYISLCFRLLRQHGFAVSCDVFEEFKSGNGRFKECLASDIQGILSLYEASYLRVHGESILDEALEFTTTHITYFAATKSTCPKLVKQINHALKNPLHRRSIRLESRHQISFYESNSSHNKTLLRFAKIDFNLLQIMHNLELRDLTRWWRSLGIMEKLPFVRDRVVEAYFWILGVYHEPHYSYARIVTNKWFKIISVIDDIYDSYGTIQELIPFTQAIQRWDKSCVNELPNYMRVIYQVILDTFEEVKQQLSLEGRSFAVYYLQQQMKDSCQAYLEEAKWCHNKIVPTYNDYMRNGIVSSGYLYVITASYQGMRELATKDAFEWINVDSKALRGSCLIARLLNDIGSHKFEKSRGHVSSALDCYISQFGSSKEEAINELQSEMEDAWKDINEDMLCPINVTLPLLSRVINLTRALYDIYRIDEDGYTMTEFLQEKIATILINPVII